MKKALVILLITISAGAFAYEKYLKPPAVKTEYVKLPPVIQVKTIRVPVKEIVVLDKTEASKKLNLPESIRSDASEQLIATGEVSPYEGKTDVVATMNTETGESSLIATQRPLPFFAFENKKEIGIGIGISSKGMDGEVYAQWSFLRIGKVHLKAYGEADRLGAKALLRAGYEF